MSILVIGHKNPDTDSIVAALSAANLLRARGLDVSSAAQGEPAPETAFVLERFRLAAPPVVTALAGRQVWLVDFSDRAQAPADFDPGCLCGIFDHHKLGDVTSDAPLECCIRPVGCVNTVIWQLHRDGGVAIPQALAGAMLCAVLSDTVLFKSPTCTPADREAAAALAKVAGVDDPQALGMAMFKAKSNLDAPAAALLRRDFKDFDMHGHKVGIGQLELVSTDLVDEHLRQELLKELAAVKADGRHSALLVLTDIMKEGSRLLLVSDDAPAVLKALGAGDSDWLPGVMSRKKQIVPPLQAAFARLP